MAIRVGDILEIETKFGLSYAQISHKVPRWGALIHVFDGSSDSRPDDFSSVIQRPVIVTTFFPVQYALNQGVVELAENKEVRNELRRIPSFREYADVDKEGNVKSWWVESPAGVEKKSELTSEEEKMPIRAVLNDTALIEAIEKFHSSRQ